MGFLPLAAEPHCRHVDVSYGGSAGGQLPRPLLPRCLDSLSLALPTEVPESPGVRWWGGAQHSGHVMGWWSCRGVARVIFLFKTYFLQKHFLGSSKTPSLLRWGPLTHFPWPGSDASLLRLVMTPLGLVEWAFEVALCGREQPEKIPCQISLPPACVRKGRGAAFLDRDKHT